MSAIAFTIHGKPFAKQRPRFSRRSGRTYTPAATSAFEGTVGQIAAPLFRQPMTGPIEIEITACFVPAASWSAKKRAAHMGQPHTQKPDLDNVQKAILDGLNRIAFADDSQVASITCRKLWRDQECTVVVVRQLEVAA